MGLGSLFLHIQLPLRNSPQRTGGNNRILVGIEPKQGYYLDLQPRKRFFFELQFQLSQTIQNIS